MDPFIYNISFQQGIPFDFIISDWLNKNTGEYYDLSDGYTARLVVRKFVGDTDPALFDLSSIGDTPQIKLYSRQIVSSFTTANTQAMVPLDTYRPLYGSPDAAPKYQAGVYELRVARAGVPYSVSVGDIFITLGIITDNG